jgi:hypothetical protein
MQDAIQPDLMVPKEKLMTVPARLKPGDTIGIVSPSWGGAGLFPQRLEKGIITSKH